MLNFFSKKNKITNVYVLRTHVLTDRVRNTYGQMQEQLGKENVFLLFDETKSSLQEDHIKWNAADGIHTGPSIITINENDCQLINRLHNQGALTSSMYKVEAQVYACYKAIRCDYKYLWFIEYDVYCHNFKTALLPYDHVKADMLTKGNEHEESKGMRTTATDEDWFWWDYLEGEISKVPMHKRRGCFFPVNRFSKKFLKLLEKNLSKSSGYCEVYFPTLCYKKGLLLKSMVSGTFGVFRYRPDLSSGEIENIQPDDHRLYHPVKN